MKKNTVSLYSPLKRIIVDALFSRNTDLIDTMIEIQTPRDPSHGDIAIPCYQFSKQLKLAPPIIAQQVAEHLKTVDAVANVGTIGAYCNITFTTQAAVIAASHAADPIAESIPIHEDNKNEREIILIESPGPNTNKPLHLGHVRNVILGDALKHILTFQGHDVHSIDIVNDRGVHICKSMLSWMLEADGEQPSDVGKKSDHYVGDRYVRYAQMEKENPEIAHQAQELLIKREAGDPDTMRVWSMMRDRAYAGIRKTCDDYGISIEKAYFESDHYRKGKEIVEEALTKGIFARNEKGHVIFDSPTYGPKVVLRADGTTTYMTQDIALGKVRREDWNMDRMIYVVGNEQDQHFALLFEIFDALGWSFAPQCHHLSYGYISLPNGKMKSREGNVVDADTLYEEVTAESLANIKERYPDLDHNEGQQRAQRIAMAAIKFFIVKYDANKDFVFDREQSLRFDGETGPYLLYTYARGRSILRGYTSSEDTDSEVLTLNPNHLDQNAHTLLVLTSQFSEVVARAASLYQPYLVARYCIELASAFNSWYHETPVLDNADPIGTKSRVALVELITTTSKQGLGLLGIDTVEVM